MKRWLWVWGPAVAQMVAIFIASSIPDLKELPGGVSDKTGHFVGYALLGALVVRALAGARIANVAGRVAALAWLWSATYAVTDEGHQYFVHGRSPDVNDWVADALGAAAAVVAALVLAGLVSGYRARSREV
jgi:VanZ family protein